jgi:glycosyltransferase involved in cell wall biosynthesis
MRVLILNQAFYPDVVSTAQHAADLAVALAEQGHEVTVLASRRGYDDPTVLFLGRELWKGVNIIRVFSTALGKSAKWRRAADFAGFIASATFRMVCLPRFNVIVAMTSPPLISFLAALMLPLKAERLVFWSMDLNPDEAIAAGWLRERSMVARLLSRMLLFSLKRADRIIALDRFMKKRIEDKGIPEAKVVVVPPWSHDDHVRFDPDGRDAFRARHDLSDKFVVMYSGNHSPCHPLDTLLQAAERLSVRSDIVFCFVGGGSEFSKVKNFAGEHRLQNILCLPYQPLEELSASLSAADLHVVVMGDPFVGIIHPCKVYNILAVNVPFVYIGPHKNHVTDLIVQISDHRVATVVRHGDVELLVQQIRQSSASYLGHLRNTNRTHSFSKIVLLPQITRAILYQGESVPPSRVDWGAYQAKSLEILTSRSFK